MTTMELKNSIIRKIAQINDSEFLKAIKTIIDSKQVDEVHITSEEQKAQIEYRLQQAKKGQTVSNDHLVNEINEWLEKR